MRSVCFTRNCICDGMNYPDAWPGGGKAQLRNFYGVGSDCQVDLFLQSKTN